MKNLLLFCLTLFLFSCSRTEKSKAVKQDEIKKVIVDNSRLVEATNDYTLKSFSIEGDVLTLEVSYTGGCGKHNFELYSNGMLMKSLPPQINVFMEHKKENETCTKEVKQTLKFDISPLKKPQNNVIVININSSENKAEWKIQ